ncbi:hypothetical protein RJ640_002476 [Escallonia rubra]|uniref:Protein kinase domain-containing protein n=1 Tax=Escallonia rubra TaxID=112253 RepID=A0AA88RBE4_9ASTE|nr:hypothetical protein RJ640_002476 [Escallonia rubra]
MLGVFLVSASPTTSKSHSRMEKAICFLFLVEAVFFIQSIRMSCSAPLRSVTSITTDQSALLALKARVVTLDPHGLFVTNWSSATPVCDWVGVICSRRHNRVAALNLSNMGLVGTIPPDIGNISFLASLDISNNSFSGSLPEEMAHLRRLREMLAKYNELNSSSSLTANQFTGTIPETLGSLGLLEFLGLGSNNFASHTSSLELSFLTSLTSCRKLRVLGLEYNLLNGTIPASIGNLSTFLEQLRATESGIIGTIPHEIGNLSSLFVLSLSANHLTGSIPTTITRFQKLQGLELSDNSLEGSIPTEFCHLHNLDSLFLRRNQFFGPVPACLGNVSSLRYLYLGGNKLSSSLPESLWNLKDLLEFDVSSNSLSGYLPSGLGSLTSARLINLSANHFSGSISATIGGSPNLVDLSLAHNTLQGYIPETFKSLISMVTLDLSHNNLSGVIPKSLEALSHLRYFNISFNNLSGEIPSGGPFVNFTSQSFVSNEALCGLTQFGVLECRAVRSRTIKTVLIIFVLSAISLTVLLMIVLFVLIRRRKGKKVPTEDDMQLIVHQRITYHEIFEATNGFEESNLIGSGSFGSVYKGVTSDGMVVAIKVFKLHTEKALKSFETECEVLRNIRHRNLTKVITSCSSLDFRALVLEYMSNGSLEDWLYSRNHYLDIKQRLDIMIDVACALDYLHHEYGLGGSVSTGTDVYSYGIMLMETFTRTKPTDEMLAGGMTLRLWVMESLPNGITKVVDMALQRQEGETSTRDVQCLTSIMELALECTKESAEERRKNFSHSSSIKQSFLTSLTSCSKLGVLGLEHNLLNGILPISIGNLFTSLEQLYAAESGIMGTIAHEICNVSSLSANDLSASILTTMTCLQKLQDIQEDPWDLKDLMELNISSNSLSGRLPRIASLKVARLVDLSFNQFSGYITSTIGGLRDLFFLSLSHNRLQGDIPESFQSLKSLVTLNLFHTTSLVLFESV